MIHTLRYRPLSPKELNTYRVEQEVVQLQVNGQRKEVRLYVVCMVIRLTSSSPVVQVRVPVLPAHRDLHGITGEVFTLHRAGAEDWLLTNGLFHPLLPRLSLSLINSPEGEKWVRDMEAATYTLDLV